MPSPCPRRWPSCRTAPRRATFVNIYAALAGEAPETVLERFAGHGFGAFKPALAELAVAVLGPISAKMKRLMAEPAEIDRILGSGAERADAIAAPILARALDITGMIRSRRG